MDTPEPRFSRRGERQLAVQVLAMPAYTNPNGDIFGGWLMSQVDIAGSIIAYQVARGRVATVAVNQFQFIGPVLVGDVVSCYAEALAIGTTSIRVRIETFVERARDPENVLRVAEAELTYVALDENGRKRAVPKTETTTR